MNRANKGAIVGGGIGLFTAVTGPSYNLIAVFLMMAVCGAIGWAIGRYLDMRKG